MQTSTVPTDLAPPCNTDGLGFRVETPFDLPCDEDLSCRGTPRVIVRNCRDDGPVEVTVHLLVGAEWDRYASRMQLNFAPVPPHEAVSYGAWFGRATDAVASAHFTRADGSLDVGFVQPFTITNTTHDRAVEACRACNGDWGRHGMMQREGCLCRMPDEGHPCEDPTDCQGVCIARGVRIARREHRTRNADGTITIAPTLGVATGQCSRYRTMFGCHGYIPEGARAAGPQPLLALPRGVRCTD